MPTATDRPRLKRAPRPGLVGRESSDPVTRYAREVESGRMPAGRAVRLACSRHLRNLDRQDSRAYPHWFDAKRAVPHIINFFKDFLYLESGAPFVLLPWQQFCLGSICGWRRTSDHSRTYRTAYVETGKGSGKTPMLAGVGLYGLVFDGEQAPEIYSAAFDKGQAGICLTHALRMAAQSPDLAGLIDIGKYNLANLSNGGFFRAVSSEHRSKSGPRPHFVLVDEVHEHRDGRVINKMQAGFKNRRQPVLFEITNAGSDRETICWQHHEHSCEVLEERVQDDQWFAYVCQLDPCATCAAEGYRQPKEGCSACDDWTDPEVWPKVNPSLPLLPGLDYLAREVDRATAMPGDRALVQRLNFCLWTATHQVWIPPSEWDACRVPSVRQANPEGLPCAAGLDPSSTLDLTALCIAIRIDDPPTTAPAETAVIEGVDESGARIQIDLTLNFSVELIPFFWLPETTLQARVQNDRIPYDVWARTPTLEQPYLSTTPGAVIDHQAIYDFIIKDVWKRFKIQRLGMDEHHGRMLFVKLRDDGRLGDRVLSVGQAKKLSEAYKFLELLVRSRRLRHNGHPVLAWNMANAEPQEDRLGSRWIEKAAETKRIDGAVAAAMAISQLMVLPTRRSLGVFVV